MHLPGSTDRASSSSENPRDKLLMSALPHGVPQPHVCHPGAVRCVSTTERKSGARDLRPAGHATGDLGIRVAMQRAYGLEALPRPREMEELAAKWHPYRTVACWYLWRSLDAPVEL